MVPKIHQVKHVPMMMTIRAQFLQQDDNKPTFAEPFTVKFTQG
jgi:hypothetical protein